MSDGFLWSHSNAPHPFFTLAVGAGSVWLPIPDGRARLTTYVWHHWLAQGYPLCEDLCIFRRIRPNWPNRWCQPPSYQSLPRSWRYHGSARKIWRSNRKRWRIDEWSKPGCEKDNRAAVELPVSPKRSRCLALHPKNEAALYMKEFSGWEVGERFPPNWAETAEIEKCFPLMCKTEWFDRT